MSLLFVMPQWGVASELWMERILDGLAPDISTIFCPEGKPPRQRDGIPIHATDSLRPASMPLIRRVARRLGLSVDAPRNDSPKKMLARLLCAADTKRTLVQYATMAVYYDNILTMVDKPLFIQCHGWDITWDLRRHENPGQKKHAEDYVARVVRLGERATFIANSEISARRLTEIGIAPERIVINYIGAPVPPCPEVRHPKTRQLRMLYLGRLVDFKGPDQVIRAFDIASERGLDAELIVAGDGPLRATCELLRSRSRFKDRISLLGAVSAEDGERLRSEADIFTAHNCFGPLSGQEEAFGVSLLEAMAAALPVITGNNGSVPELITNENNGILVEPNDVEGHAQAFLDLAASPERRRFLGENAWREARSRFDLTLTMRGLRRAIGLPSPPDPSTSDKLTPCLQDTVR